MELVTLPVLCVLLDDGQSGVAARGDKGEAQKNKADHTHRS